MSKPKSVIKPENTTQHCMCAEAGYTKTRTIAVIALVGVLLIPIGIVAGLGKPRGSVQENSILASPFTAVATPKPSASPTGDQEDETTTPSTAEATLANLVDSPESYMNQQVTVAGEATVVYTDRAFLIDGPGLINDTFLVFSKTPFDQEKLEKKNTQTDNILEITGTVQRFNQNSLGNALGVLLPDNQYGRFDDQAYILVEHVGGE